MKSSKLAPKQMCVFFAQELCFVFGGKYGCLVEVSCIWNRQFWNFLLADFGQKFRFILKKRRLGLQVIFLLFSFYDSRKKCPFEWRIFPFSLMPTSAAVIIYNNVFKKPSPEKRKRLCLGKKLQINCEEWIKKHDVNFEQCALVLSVMMSFLN